VRGIFATFSQVQKELGPVITLLDHVQLPLEEEK